ncbi:hypothetical protein [Phocaeicola salanitronis]|uniref:hypothetical protein n=1 Tax=Phocaeicola salanitronis TaxID=376805 RepID=UPI0023F642CD|nr:hypothetical protein [Phocaeicola salanitronis]
MRKKYLSALLFGALLFASAGTFTSCKDYDDDIDNLSQRIDQVASDLNDLKTKVDALGGYVENVSFADGVLSVTTGGNTVTYNIPDKTGVNEVTLALDGNNLVLTVDGEAQTIALPAGETGEVEIPEIEVKDGVLYINGEPQTLKVDVESNVTVIESTIPGNETYTVMVNGEEVTFAKAFADVRISLMNNGDDFLFTEYKNGSPALATPQENGIHWAFASKDYTWADGVKDAPKSGELVVGQITAAKVSVRPVSYDLKAHQDELTLVSSTGQTARAKVLVYESGDNGPIESGSRAASTNVDALTHGDYVIAIQLDPTLTAEEIIKAFANADNTANLKYALALNGTVVTDYQFVIDTQLKADTQAKCEDPNEDYFVIGGKEIDEAPLGTHQMAYLDGRIYDMKVTIDPSSEDDAEVYGVSINPKTNEITASDAAAERTFKLNITLIDVNGNVSKTETVKVTFEKADVAPVTKLEPTVVTVTPRADKSFVINLQDALSSLDASDAIYIKEKSNIEWGIEKNDNGFFMSEYEIENANITYFEDAECKKEVDLSDGVTSEKLRKIKYAKIENTDYNIGSTLGEHLLTLTIKKYRTIGDASDIIEFRTINVPVDVKEPTWEDLFAQADNNWADGVFTTRISNYDISSRKAAISLDAYKVKDDKNGATKDGIEVVYVGANIDGNEVNVINNTLATDPEDNEPLNVVNGKAITQRIELDTDASVATADGELKVSDVTVNYQYIIYAQNGTTPVFVIEKKDVKVAIKSMYADLKLVWLDKDGNETAGPAVLNADNTINGTGSAKSPKANGLAFAFYKQYVEAGDADAAQYNTFSVEGIAGDSQKLTESSDNFATLPSDQGIVYFVWDASNENGGTVTVNASAAHTGKSDGTYGKASYIHLEPTANALEKGTIKVTFMDAMGVKHTSEVSFAK